MSAAREARLLQAATTDLLNAVFHKGPVFRMGFDAHVRAWRKANDQECWVRFHTDAHFAAAYEERLAETRRAI